MLRSSHNFAFGKYFLQHVGIGNRCHPGQKHTLSSITLSKPVIPRKTSLSLVHVAPPRKILLRSSSWQATNRGDSETKKCAYRSGVIERAARYSTINDHKCIYFRFSLRLFPVLLCSLITKIENRPRASAISGSL